MDNLHHVMSTIIHVRVMNQEIVQIQKIDVFHIDPLVFDHLQIHVDT